MDIRPPFLTDLPEMRRLYQMLVDEKPAPYPTFDATDLAAFVQTLAPAILNPPPTFCCRVAADPTDPTRLLGFFAGEIMSRAIGHPRVYAAAHYLIVDPAARGGRVARALIKEAIQWVQTNFPEVKTVEAFALAGDPQWARRGWQPFLVKHVRVLADLPTRMVDSPPSPPTPEVSDGRLERLA